MKEMPKNIEIIGETITGDKGVMETKKSGTDETDEMKFVKENGAWKIDFGG